MWREKSKSLGLLPSNAIFPFLHKLLAVTGSEISVWAPKVQWHR